MVRSSSLTLLVGQPLVADIQVEGNPGSEFSLRQAAAVVPSERAVKLGWVAAGLVCLSSGCWDLSGAVMMARALLPVVPSTSLQWVARAQCCQGGFCWLSRWLCRSWLGFGDSVAFFCDSEACLFFQGLSFAPSRTFWRLFFS